MSPSAPGFRGRVEDIMRAERMRGSQKRAATKAGGDPREPRALMSISILHFISAELPCLRERLGAQPCGDLSCTLGLGPAAYLDLNITSPGQVFIKLRSGPMSTGSYQLFPTIQVDSALLGFVPGPLN